MPETRDQILRKTNIQTAVAFIIKGALVDEMHHIDIFSAIFREIEDWAEGGNQAADPETIYVALNVPRTPANIEAAINLLIEERRDLG